MATGSNSTPPARRGSWYQRLFAAAMASENERDEESYGGRKHALLADLHGDILEIGPGAGPNLAYYSRDIRWHGLEPNPAMLPYIQREAERLGLSIDLREGRAEQLDAPDGSFDAVVGTLVMCSVRDPQRTLREILRVLKPGGRYVFIEHVAAPRKSVSRRIQGIVKPIWKLVSDGCEVDRETGATIQAAGFSSVQIEDFRVETPIVAQHIAGYAVK
ncbi:MAG TPA: methyltransferase domain-containing protein [Aggregatilineales bacterium]|nr:methyltransferase domain-containing protein [Aggregatilineales bacterium]